jgi:hypothetical protein
VGIGCVSAGAGERRLDHRDQRPIDQVVIQRVRIDAVPGVTDREVVGRSARQRFRDVLIEQLHPHCGDRERGETPFVDRSQLPDTL